MKPWPADALMVVAPDAGTEKYAPSSPAVPVMTCCRDCHKALAASSETIRLAAAHPHRRGRPVNFFCIECAVAYDSASLDGLEDHRLHRYGG